MARNWLLLVKVIFLVAQPSLPKPSNFLVFTKDNNQEGNIMIYHYMFFFAILCDLLQYFAICKTMFVTILKRIAKHCKIKYTFI